MARKILLWGAVGVGALLLLSGKAQAAQSKPPALPGPLPRAVPRGTVTPGTITQIRSPAADDVRRLDQAAAAQAAAASAAAAARSRASAGSPASSAPLVPPVSDGLTPPPVSAPASEVSPVAPPSIVTPSEPQPSGYDPEVARRGAKAVASHLARTGRSGYDRRLLRQWQTQAGLTGDGIYGGATRGALIFYGVKDPPRAFFKPVDTIPFSPPE